MRVCNLMLFTFALFLVLKLAGGVDWSWGFVLLPLAGLIGAWWREDELLRDIKQKLNTRCPRPYSRPLLGSKK